MHSTGIDEHCFVFSQAKFSSHSQIGSQGKTKKCVFTGRPKHLPGNVLRNKLRQRVDDTGHTRRPAQKILIMERITESLRTSDSPGPHFPLQLGIGHMVQLFQNIFLIVLQMDKIRPPGYASQALRESPRNLTRSPGMKNTILKQGGIPSEQGSRLIHGKKGIAGRAEIVRFRTFHR